MLDARKQLILQAIVDSYVKTAVPVGSKAICGQYSLGLSSATVRNEMSDLTEMGYLEQPHVSAGRVPRVKAYRYYVDMLPKELRLPHREEAELLREMSQRLKRMDDLVADAVDYLSEVTGYTALAMLPRQDDLRIASLHLVPISSSRALVVVVTDGGIMRDAFVEVSEGLDRDALYAISRMLSERLHMRTLGEAQELLRSYVQNAPWEPQVLSGIAQLASQLEKQSLSDTLKLSGPHQLLNYPEYSAVDKARTVLAALDERESLLALMRDCAHLGLNVSIGPENGISRMKDLSIVTASYVLGRGHRGAIGLIGPVRMPYQKVLGTLSIVSRRLSQLLGSQEYKVSEEL